MKQKRQKQGGFSLVEMLVAILILTMLTSLGAAGITAALSTREDSIRAAEADVLLSTVSLALADELRFGQNITTGDNRFTLDSSRYGPSTTFSVVDGYLMAGSYALFTEDTYGTMKVESLSVSKDAEGKIYTIVITIKDGAMMQSRTTTIAPLNVES